MAEAFFSQLAWSCINDGKSAITAFTHSGEEEILRSRETFILCNLAPMTGSPKAIEEAKIAYTNYIHRFFIHEVSRKAKLNDAGIFVVIPSYAEETLTDTLNSLASCIPTETAVSVVVVINGKDDDTPDQKLLNQRGFEAVSQLQTKSLHIHWVAIDATGIKDKNAGVGLARKIGMDAVILHVASSGENPALVCLDADCIVAEDYLVRLETEFYQSSAQVASLEFSHPVDENTDPVLRKGIAEYEVYLEYYRLGLHYAGYPFFHHTVGSSMACKALPYARSGGMNQRKAGEDFYFLHKLFPHYAFIAIYGPMVFPSCRISTRVPFGTGRFQQKWTDEGASQYLRYHPDCFRFLKIFLELTDEFLRADVPVESPDFARFRSAHPGCEEWWKATDLIPDLERIRRSSVKTDLRIKAFYAWFDGLAVLRFVHFFDPWLPFQPPAESICNLVPQFSGRDPFQLVAAVRKHLYENPVSHSE